MGSRAPVYYQYKRGECITYCFFYVFNNVTAGKLTALDHEGDWERIWSKLDGRDQATAVAYSQHDGACQLSWNKAPKRGMVVSSPSAHWIPTRTIRPRVSSRGRIGVMSPPWVNGGTPTRIWWTRVSNPGSVTAVRGERLAPPISPMRRRGPGAARPTTRTRLLRPADRGRHRHRECGRPASGRCRPGLPGRHP
ncbi:hypothetical protein FRAAL3303 [Frankia alni ACN14a]|uniref:Uncharacterized protein n=1 Tax=Frankia alni (strain DSM 45986 / CECT 9034 / ACN14a) TaxID=326424 RepID=Q0RKL1_FRAAA|nr:hypothetical protein FRAAL3303 [Frankia alni ACN14a]